MSFRFSHGDDLRQVRDIAAWRAGKAFDPSRGVPIAVWRAMAAKRAAVDYVRSWNHLRSYGRGVSFVSLPDSGPAASCQSPTPEPGLERAIHALPPRQRELIQLVFWHGRSFREISVDWGVSVSTVYNHHYQAIRNLRRMLCAPPFRASY